MIGSTAFHARAYADAGDLIRLEQFLLEAASARASSPNWHSGSLLWSMSYHSQHELQRDIRLWEDATGALQAFAWFEEPNLMESYIHPRYRGAEVLESSIFAWAADHLRAVHPEERRLSTTAEPTDTAYIEYLMAQGFEYEGAYRSQLRREFSGPIPKPQLLEGWRVRQVAEPAEWAARVNVHQAAWQATRFTLEVYSRLRQAPGYRPDLDIVAEAPDGTFGAYGTFWLDPRNHVGLLAVVGTRPMYRRQGLGTAVLHEGCRRLQAYGASSIWVTTGAASVRAIAFYESVGFRLIFKDQRYARLV